MPQGSLLRAQAAVHLLARPSLSQLKHALIVSAAVALLAWLAPSPRRRLAILYDRAIALARPALIVVLAAASLFYAYQSLHWQLMVDSPVMHYVNFLIDHGRLPYTDITDNNMPGAYYTEALAMRVFGAGDLAWRLYDFFLLTTLTATLVLIARRHDWLAGFFAATLFIVIHAAEGPKYSVEREQVLTILLMLGYAAMFAAIRRRQPLWMLALGLASGVAVSIKPTFLPLPLLLIAITAFVARRRAVAAFGYVAWSLLGLTLVALLDVAYLAHFHAIAGFLFILRVVTPTYTALARMPFWQLLYLSLPLYIPAVLALTILTAFLRRQRRTRWTYEQWSLAAGAAFGLFSFMAQGKPFLHHRYTLLITLFLLIGFELLEALRDYNPAQSSTPTKLPNSAQALALATVAFILFWIVPLNVREVLVIHRQLPAGQSIFTLALEQDLTYLGGPAALDDKVQCFDLVYGCLGALNRLKIVENTSYTGDLLLFTRHPGPAAEYYRNKYWASEQTDPASVIVMSNEWFQEKNNFDKIAYWPPFVTFLAANYTQVIERRFAGQGDDPKNPDGYRIYIRTTSPLLKTASAVFSSATK